MSRLYNLSGLRKSIVCKSPSVCRIDVVFIHRHAIFPFFLEEKMSMQHL